MTTDEIKAMANCLEGLAERVEAGMNFDKAIAPFSKQISLVDPRDIALSLLLKAELERQGYLKPAT